MRSNQIIGENEGWRQKEIKDLVHGVTTEDGWSGGGHGKIYARAALTMMVLWLGPN